MVKFINLSIKYRKQILIIELAIGLVIFLIRDIALGGVSWGPDYRGFIEFLFTDFPFMLINFLALLPVCYFMMRFSFYFLVLRYEKKNIILQDNNISLQKAAYFLTYCFFAGFFIFIMDISVLYSFIYAPFAFVMRLAHRELGERGKYMTVNGGF
ncbi:MAG: hypothetical protein FWE37_08220 [Spirochaetaceae bacterium]|nr:hypothetical protein [Spirochaetaceae bacterium]